MKCLTNPPSTFTTERLHLRKPEVADAEAIFDAYASDADIPRFMKWPAHRSPEQTAGFLETCLKEWEAGTDFAYVIERLKEPGRPVGMMTLHRIGSRAGFGYVLERAQWNKGFASEALRMFVDWSLSQPQVFRAQAFCDAENVASARVMEKAGMAFEGILRRYCIHPNISEEPRDCRMYARTR